MLGGDGTMLRALDAFPRHRRPVLGVNFGRVGLPDGDRRRTSSSEGLERVFAGDYRRVELPTIEVTVGGETHCRASTTP